LGDGVGIIERDREYGKKSTNPCELFDRAVKKNLPPSIPMESHQGAMVCCRSEPHN
jgi:hypothetical protein